MIVIRKNVVTDEVINEYELGKDEIIFMQCDVLYIVTKDEFNKFQKGEIEDCEFDDAPYYLEKDEIFIIEK